MASEQLKAVHDACSAEAAARPVNDSESGQLNLPTITFFIRQLSASGLGLK